MLQNQSSSAESAHANTEASVSGHHLDSGGNNEDARRNNIFNPECFCPKEEEREFRLISTKQEGKECKVKRKVSKVKGKRRVK